MTADLESRVEALEHDMRRLLEYYESFHRLERKKIDEARLYAARNGGELVTRRDIQRIKHASRITVDQWAGEPDFPSPVQQSRTGTYLYGRAQFEEWYQKHILKPKVRARMKLKEEGK